MKELIKVLNLLKKKIKILLNSQLIKNLNIYFKEDETNIKFDDYYFNGIPTPLHHIIYKLEILLEIVLQLYGK